MMRLRAYAVAMLVVFSAFSPYIRTMLLPSLDTQIRYLVVGGDLLMAGLALSAIWRRRSFFGSQAMAVFLVISSLTFAANAGALEFGAHLNGLRQPLFFLSSLIVFYDLLDADGEGRLHRAGVIFLVVFALLQIPTAVHQFIVFGPGDAVGGTYGVSGGSGYLTQLVFLITFFLCVVYASRDDGRGFVIWRVAAFTLLLIPTALNETKISFLLLPLFMLLLAFNSRRLYASLPLLGIGAVLGYFLYAYYSENVMEVDKMMTPEFLEQYLVYDARQNVDIPRFQKIVLMLSRMSTDLSAQLLGYGYGLFVGRNFMGTSLYIRSFWYFEGTRALLNTVWLQGGILAVLTFLYATFGFLRGSRSREANVRRFRLFLALLLLSTWIYNEALFDRLFALIISFFVAWLMVGAQPDRDPISTALIDDEPDVLEDSMEPQSSP